MLFLSFGHQVVVQLSIYDFIWTSVYHKPYACTSTKFNSSPIHLESTSHRIQYAQYLTLFRNMHCKASPLHSCQQSRFERDNHNFVAVFTVPPDRHFHQRNVPIQPKSTTTTYMIDKIIITNLHNSTQF